MPAMPLTKTPRWIERRHTTEAEHLIALDNDADNFEGAVYVMQTNHEELSSKLDRLNARMFGVLVSLVTAALALAANVVFHH